LGSHLVGIEVFGLSQGLNLGIGQENLGFFGFLFVVDVGHHLLLGVGEDVLNSGDLSTGEFVLKIEEIFGVHCFQLCNLPVIQVFRGFQ